MTRTYIPESLIQMVIGKPLDPRYALVEVMRNSAHPLQAMLLRALDTLPPEIIEEVTADPVVKSWLKAQEDMDDPQRVRFEVLLKVIDDEIYERRRKELLQRGSRSRPYDHPALSGIEPDEESLVPLTNFSVKGDFISRNGFVFSPTPPLRAVNSQYWSSMVLFGLPADITVRIRLDPFIVIPVDSYSPLFYKMRVFGRDLDWQQIDQLKDKEIARWMPDEMTSEVEFTEVVWQRRSNEVHFECEEIPINAAVRPSRYFHAVYIPAKKVFVHSDAAVRYYTEKELSQRKQERLHRLGKVGTRLKLFRAEGSIDCVTWSTLVAGSFIWNNDVQRYFQGERPFDVEHAPSR